MYSGEELVLELSETQKAFTLHFLLQILQHGAADTSYTLQSILLKHNSDQLLANN